MKGQVYRIEFPDGYFYYGSTIRSLETRLAGHKSERLNSLRKKQAAGNKALTRFEIYLARCGWNNPTISTHTYCEVDYIWELHDIEMRVIKVHYDDPKCLNEQLAGKPRVVTVEQKLKHKLGWLHTQLNRTKERWREFWIGRVLDNWLSRSDVYPDFVTAMTEFEDLSKRKN